MIAPAAVGCKRLLGCSCPSVGRCPLRSPVLLVHAAEALHDVEASRVRNVETVILAPPPTQGVLRTAVAAS